MKLNEAMILANSAIEIISSKNNIYPADIEKIASLKTLNISDSNQDYHGLWRQIGKNWNFDMFFWKNCSNNKPITTLGCFCLKRYGLDRHFNIPELVYTRFFEALEERYNKNPFHNATHASDTLHSFLYFIFNSNLIDYISSWFLLSVIIACLGHDVGHPGLTNHFLIDNKDELAILYNDFSVLEMMHCSTIFQIMKQSNTNILGILNYDKYKTVREAIIEMILATDISKTFDILRQFRAKLINSPVNVIRDFENMIIIMKIMIKCADIGYTAKQKEINERWSLLLTEERFNQGDIQRLNKEHFNQGDFQRLKNQIVYLHCDRKYTDIAKSQTVFLKNIALPLYEGLNQFLDSSNIDSNCVGQLKTNIKYWENTSGKRNKSQKVIKKEHTCYDKLSKKWFLRKRSFSIRNIETTKE